jgi:hypothetical protein
MPHRSLTLLHTAQAHQATFDTLRDRIAPGVRLTHLVRPDLLIRAQVGIDSALISDVSDIVTAAAAPVVCTCTTIGAVAASAGAIRIDAPMMQAAAQSDGAILLAYCLQSTRTPSLDLLQTALSAAQSAARVHLLYLGDLWPLFEAKETTAFHAALAAAITAELTRQPDVTAVVLAQASMAGAAALLSDIAIPVFSSPESALRAALA